MIFERIEYLLKNKQKQKGLGTSWAEPAPFWAGSGLQAAMGRSWAHGETGCVGGSGPRPSSTGPDSTKQRRKRGF
jgi:hypothetical protein